MSNPLKNPSRCIFDVGDISKYTFQYVLLEISMVIVIIRLVRFLLKPLKQPRIVAEIIGGIILGPSCLGRSSTFSSYVFTENSEYIMKNCGLLGFMYFLFLCGVKTDLTTIERSGKKQWYIALYGVLVPFLASVSIALFLRKSLLEDLANVVSISGVAMTLAITAFPVIYTILREFNLLSSEIGRMALSTAVISDVIGMNGVVVFEASKQGEKVHWAALWYIVSLVFVMVLILAVVRHAMLWIVRTTPEGQPVDQIYIVVILLGVMVFGFLTDFLGLAIGNGPLWLGLAVPDGPPLGATLVEKSETFILEILMPFSYVYIGIYTDVFSMSERWVSLKPICVMALVAFLTKLVTTLAVSRFFNMPYRDSFALSLMMSLRGQVELIMFIHWTDLKMITQPYFTMLVLVTTAWTAITTPLINIIYDPTRPYMVNIRRNIQHHHPDTELNIVLTVHDEQSVAGFINLLEVSNPTENSPFLVYALRLIELVGRATPLFIDHENQEHGSNYNSYNPIHNALKFSYVSWGKFVKVHPFTSVSPKKSMYQDICELALMKKASLIILLYNKVSLDTLIGTEGGGERKKIRSLNSNVLAHAPCSVGLLVEKGPSTKNIANNVSMVNVMLLFLGGSDAREALAYADRMVGHPDVSLTVVRFLSQNGEGDQLLEKKLDDGLVTRFWVKNERNDRVTYKEVEVINGKATVGAIQALNNGCYDLWIVGRKHGINPVLLLGLANWSEDNELGVIGEYICSMDLGSTANVLVVQQQVLRGWESVRSTGGFLPQGHSVYADL